MSTRVVLAACLVAAACSKKNSGAGGGSGSAIAGSGSADAVDAATAAPPVVDPLPDAVWATAIPPFRLSSPPLALWADDKRAVAVVRGLDGTRLAAIDLTTGLVMYSAPHDQKFPIRFLARLPSGDLVGIGGNHDNPGVFTIDPAKLTMTPRASALGTTSLRAIDRATVAPDGTIVLGGISQTLWALSPDLSAARKLDNHSGWRAFAFVDGKRLIGSNMRDEIWSIDPSGAAQKTRIAGPRGAVLAVSPAGTAVASHDEGSALFDIATGAERARLSPAKLQAAAFSADGATLFVHDQSDLVIRDAATGAEKKRIAIGRGYEYDSATARMVVASPRHVVAMAGAAVRVVDVTAGTVAPLGGEPTRAPWLLAFSGDDVISVGIGSALRFSSAGKPEPIANLDTLAMSTAALSPSGKLLAVADDKGVVVLDLPTTTKQRRSVEDVGTVAISDDGLVTFDRSDFDKSATTIDTAAPGGKVENLLAFHIDSTVDSFTPDGKRAVIARAGGAVVYDLAADKAIARKIGVPTCDSSETIYIADDGARVAASHDKQATAFDVAADKPIATIETEVMLDHAVPITGSTDVLLVAAGGIVVWDTVAATAKLTRIPGDIAGAVVDRAAKRVAIGFRSGRIAVYDLAKLKSGGPFSIKPSEHPSCDEVDPLASPGEDEIGDGDGDE